MRILQSYQHVIFNNLCKHFLYTELKHIIDKFDKRDFQIRNGFESYNAE